MDTEATERFLKYAAGKAVIGVLTAPLFGLALVGFEVAGYSLSNPLMMILPGIPLFCISTGYIEVTIKKPFYKLPVSLRGLSRNDWITIAIMVFVDCVFFGVVGLLLYARP
jgi:hypothetical protein